MHFGTGQSRDERDRCDTLVTTSATGATRTTRVRGRRHSVDSGGHVHLTFFPELVPEIYANLEHRRLDLYTRALLFRRPPCWTEDGATRTTDATRTKRHDTTRTRRVVT